MPHKTSFYRDGFQEIEFCLQCGKESSELIEECRPLIVHCSDCGNKYWQSDCPHCKTIRLNFKKAIDSHR